MKNEAVFICLFGVPILVATGLWAAGYGAYAGLIACGLGVAAILAEISIKLWEFKSAKLETINHQIKQVLESLENIAQENKIPEHLVENIGPRAATLIKKQPVGNNGDYWLWLETRDQAGKEHKFKVVEIKYETNLCLITETFEPTGHNIFIDGSKLHNVAHQKNGYDA